MDVGQLQTLQKVRTTSAAAMAAVREGSYVAVPAQSNPACRLSGVRMEIDERHEAQIGIQNIFDEDCRLRESN
jgi:hypothetical protein